MTSRFRLALVAGTLALAGCSEAFNAPPVRYRESPRLTETSEDGTPKVPPKLQEEVRSILVELFGTPKRIRVPEGAGLPLGGQRLARYAALGEGEGLTLHPQYFDEVAPGREVEGGYALYREHCLHCHGVTGDGDGPTADFLFPRPRDYRKGIFKFTSTAGGAKPTRADLYKTIDEGVHGTSMPAFGALMTPDEIEQVIDYLIFLSARGETEQLLIDEAGLTDPEDEEALKEFREAIAPEIARNVFAKWQAADDQVLNPPVPRTPPSDASIARGRELFLGRTPQKLECAGCHGPKAEGNGPSFVDQRIFDLIVFRGELIEPGEWKTPAAERKVEAAIRERWQELRDLAAGHEHTDGPHGAPPPVEPPGDWKDYHDRVKTTWETGSFDDWGVPLRPANLNRGVYKGGRRPIDIYWRIAKGINGAKMPAHASALKPEEIWDLVNFVLALPYRPELLREPAAAAPSRAVARR